MTFGEKIRELRKKNGLSQAELGKKIGASVRTVAGWEIENRYPKQRSLYSKLAEVLGCEVDYLLSEKESFITDAAEQFGYRGERGATELINEVTGLFSGGKMQEEDMDAFMFAVQQAYLDAKMKNKKYTPKKYLNNDKSDNA